MQDTPVWMELLVPFASVLATALAGLLARLLSKLADDAAEKTNLRFLARVDDVIMDVVTDSLQTKVRQLKAAAADGKLTEEEKAELKSLPVDAVKKHFNMKLLGKLFGGEDLVDEALARKVEKAVLGAKSALGK